MSQPTTPAPLAAPPPGAPPVPPDPAWAPPVGPPLAGPGAPWPPVVRPARRRRVLLALLAVAALAALSLVGVQLAAGLRHDAAEAGAQGTGPLAGAVPPVDPGPGTGSGAGSGMGSGVGQPSPGLPPSAVPDPTAVLPPAAVQPGGLGTDPALDGEAEGCFTGVMTACVELYLESYRDPALARYTAYGDTCAGRQPAGTLRLCTASFPR